MNKGRKYGLLPWLAFGAGLVMASIVYVEIRARPMIDEDISSQATTAEVRLTLPTHARQAMPEKTRFAVLVERPLFSPSRRPHSAEAAVASVSSPAFSLSGVVISTGEPVALVRPDAGGDPMRVIVGEEISGWRVTQIESNRILVQHDEMQRELFLDFAAAPPPLPETLMPLDAQAYRKAVDQSTWQPNEGEDDEEEPEPVPPSETDEAIDRVSLN